MMLFSSLYCVHIARLVCSRCRCTVTKDFKNIRVSDILMIKKSRRTYYGI